MYLVSYRRNREILYETPRQVPLNGSVRVAEARGLIDALVVQGRNSLTEMESKALLEEFGIPTARPRPARTPLEAVEIAREIGFPVVMKVDSPQILHKTEVHGVVTGVASRTKCSVYSAKLWIGPAHATDAEVNGVTLQRC
jgi:acetyltransferase